MKRILAEGGTAKNGKIAGLGNDHEFGATMRHRILPLLLSLLSLSITSCSIFTDDDGSGHVGLVGCSLTQDAAAGYTAAGGDRLWLREDIPTYGGGDPEAWANSDASRWWPDFDAAMARYPDTDAIWWGLCNSPRTSGAALPYETILAVLAEIQSRAPGGATVYVSAAPARVGYECYLETAAGQALLAGYADRLVAEGRALRGPAMTPLKEDQTRDGCHTDEDGELVWGADLLAFFGRL